MLRSLFYVSRCEIDPYFADAEIKKIVSMSNLRNGLEGISGALVFNGLHFAQFVEGRPVAIEDLLTKIRNDRRHSNIDVVFDDPADSRQFTGWDMAYAGPSSFLGSRVLEMAELMCGDPQRVRLAGARLVMHLMREIPMAA